MRKRDPDSVVEEFTAELDSLAESADALAQTVALTDARRTYTDALMRLAVAWEVFRSDWYIACINRNSSAMRVVVEAEVRAQTSKAGRGAALGAWNQGWIHVSVPHHPTLEQISAALDPNSYNLSLPSSIRDHGGLLAQPYSARVEALNPADDGLIAAVVALRNAIAHRSRSSIGRLNDSLMALTQEHDPGLRLDPAARRVRVGGIGRYLGASDVNGPNTQQQPRYRHFYLRVRAIAEAHL